MPASVVTLLHGQMFLSITQLARKTPMVLCYWRHEPSMYYYYYDDDYYYYYYYKSTDYSDASLKLQGHFTYQI